MGLAAASLALPRALSFDAWSWLVWGRELGRLDLHTVGGPAWKPLPALVDAVLAPLGSAAPVLWLFVVRVAALLALVVAFRLGKRLGGTIGGVVAVVGLVFERDAFSSVGLGTSEWLLGLFVLVAVERALSGRERQGFVALYGAALLRPEAWVFLAGFGAWLVWRDRRAWWWVVGLGVLLPVVWFGADLWGAGDLGRSSARAKLPDRTSLRGLPGAEERITPVLLEELIPPVLAGVVLALARGERMVRWLAWGGLAWIALDLLLVLVGGYAGSARYFFGAFAVLAVAAGGAWGRVLAGRPRWVVVGAVLVLASAVGRGIEWAPDARSVGRAASLRVHLIEGVRAAGGRGRLLGCRRVASQSAQVSLVAWTLDVRLASLATRAGPGPVLQAEGTARQPGLAPPVDPARPTWARAGPWRIRGCR